MKGRQMRWKDKCVWYEQKNARRVNRRKNKSELSMNLITYDVMKTSGGVTV
jgi:hypothetical protein